MADSEAMEKVLNSGPKSIDGNLLVGPELFDRRHVGP